MHLSDQLIHIRQSLGELYPELFLTVFFLVALGFELFISKPGTPDKPNTPMAGLHWFGAAGYLLLTFFQYKSPEVGSFFFGMLTLDAKATLFKILIAIAWIISLYHIQKVRYRFQPVFYLLLSSTVLGASFLCMSTDLLMLFLSIEIISLSSYLLVGLSPYAKASEGGLKYLLFGGVSSAIMLYGMSFVYGITGTTTIGPGLWEALANTSPLAVSVISLLLLGGLLFKLSLIPFHIWTPDTYEATPTSIVSFMSAVPKIAVLLALSRVMAAMPETAFPLLGGIALISMTVGNVGALWQQNARRLMAYSTIAQAGYLVVGIVVLGETGFQAATFYVIAYVLLSMSAFLLIDLFLPQSDTPLQALEGKGKTWIWGGVAMTLVMVGLAGIPPTIGFTGKWLVFSSLWDGYHSDGQRWKLILLIGGILNAAISLAYYLRIPFLMFFRDTTDENNEGQPALSLTGLSSSIVAGIIILLTVLFFLQPEILMAPISRL